MIPGVRLVVLGKQGAGKGTQCVRLSHHYVVPHVSTGDMLRSEVKSRSPLGQRAHSLMEQGELIPDEMVMEMVGGRLSERDTTGRGFVLDGCPRTTVQAESLEKIVQPFGLDIVIDLQVPTNLVMKRLASRRVCVDCGANYSTAAPPLVNWTCDVCGGEVVQREDDTEEAIERRLNLYEEETAPLLDWYKERSLLVEINGTGSPDAVTRRVVGAIDTLRRKMKGDGPSEAERRRAGQDAPRRQGRGRDARGDPGRRQARASPPPTWTPSPARSSSAGAPPRISSATTASRPSSAPRPTP